MIRNREVRILVVAAFLVVGSGVSIIAILQSKRIKSAREAEYPERPTVDLLVIEPQVIAFCGDCHATPSPCSFPRDAWFDEVNRGYEFYHQSGRQDLKIPLKSDVYAYYQMQAPETLEIPSTGRLDSGGLRFRKEELQVLSELQQAKAPAVAHIKWVVSNESAGSSSQLLVCDMRRNSFSILRLTESGFKVHASCSGGHFAHAEATDLDGDGRSDYVLADLGSFLPEDHDRGRVLWVTERDDGSLSEPIVLAQGLGRVADVRPVDLDGDGDLDLVVAEFGHLKTGRVLVLWNTGVHNGVPQFEQTTVDVRHGAIHTPIIDINNNGTPDFMALMSQEYETIDLFRNDGKGSFRRETVYSAGDPSFGSSGIELVDLDQDGDIDILYTNGDMHDSHYIKPYHSVQWIENRGEMGWQHHLIANMPGVFRALPADMDGDGDIDIVASSFVPDFVANAHEGLSLASLIWLEQTSPGEFVQHVLEVGATNHATIELGDFDMDGDIDIAVGEFQETSSVAVTIWWNES